MICDIFESATKCFDNGPTQLFCPCVILTPNYTFADMEPLFCFVASQKSLLFFTTTCIFWWIIIKVMSTPETEHGYFMS
jgi:hypothetical protein